MTARLRSQVSSYPVFRSTSDVRAEGACTLSRRASTGSIFDSCRIERRARSALAFEENFPALLDGGFFLCFFIDVFIWIDNRRLQCDDCQGSIWPK